jgi:hypothetical protein
MPLLQPLEQRCGRHLRRLPLPPSSLQVRLIAQTSCPSALQRPMQRAAQLFDLSDVAQPAAQSSRRRLGQNPIKRFGGVHLEGMPPAPCLSAALICLQCPLITLKLREIDARTKRQQLIQKTSPLRRRRPEQIHIDRRKRNHARARPQFSQARDQHVVRPRALESRPQRHLQPPRRMRALSVVRIIAPSPSAARSHGRHGSSRRVRNERPSSRNKSPPAGSSSPARSRRRQA